MKHNNFVFLFKNNMEPTFIEKLQQIERVKLYDLLCDSSIWNSMYIDYHKPYVERLWCQLGKYRLSLHFIHVCERDESLFHPHPWPSAVHVIEGSYEMGIGYGEGLEEPEVISTMLAQSGIYYDMTNKDSWHYVRPLSVCSSVMLTGEPWDREMPLFDESKGLGGLHNDRVIVMLDYFKSKFYHTIKTDSIVESINRGDWVVLDEKKMSRSDHSEFESILGEKGFVIKNTEESGICIRFNGKRYDDFEPGILRRLGEADKREMSKEENEDD